MTKHIIITVFPASREIFLKRTQNGFLLCLIRACQFFVLFINYQMFVFFFYSVMLLYVCILLYPPKYPEVATDGIAVPPVCTSIYVFIAGSKAEKTEQLSGILSKVGLIFTWSLFEIMQQS